MRKTVLGKRILAVIMAACVALEPLPAFAVEEDIIGIDAAFDEPVLDEVAEDYFEEDQIVFDEDQGDVAFEDVLEGDTASNDVLEDEVAFDDTLEDGFIFDDEDSFYEEEELEAVTEKEALFDVEYAETTTEVAQLPENALEVDDLEELATEPETGLKAENTDTSGVCGPNLTWTVDGEGTLTISGTGEMYSYFEYDEHPWDGISIKNIIFEEGVTHIGSYAFFDLSSLRSVTLPSTLKTIGSGAFMYSGLHDISIPLSVTTIGEDAFNTSSLTVIYYGGTKTDWDNIEIGNGNDHLLETIIYFSDTLCVDSGLIPNPDDSNTYIEWFYSDDGLLRIIARGGTSYIGSSLFPENPPWDVYKDNVTTLKIKGIPIWDKGLTIVGFQNYPALEQVWLNEVRDIGQEAFFNCTKLKTVSWENEDTTTAAHILQAAFMDCSSLETISFPLNQSSYTYSYSYIDSFAFAGCTNLTEVPLSTGWELDGLGYANWKPTEPVKNRLIEIYQKAGLGFSEDYEGVGQFADCTSLTSIHFPEYKKDGYTPSIPKLAFLGCSSLEYINLPENIIRIGSQCFWGTNIKNLVIPSSTRFLSLQGTTSLEKVTFSMNSSIDLSADFRDCINLKEVIFPDNNDDVVIDSCTSNCENCYKLQKINLLNWDVFSPGAFRNCTSLKRIDLAGDVEIGKESFKGCTSLKNIYFHGNAPVPGESDEEHDEGAFINVFSGVVANAYYPAENPTWTEEVRAALEKNDTDLYTKITWIPYYGELLPANYKCGDNLIGTLDDTVLTIQMSDELDPDGTREMYDTGSEQLWGQAKDLITEVIVKDASSIGASAFEECAALEKVTFYHNSVSDINAMAFKECKKLKEIIFADEAPDFADDCFSGITADVYYRNKDSSWDKDNLKNYGGTINWIGYGDDENSTSVKVNYSGTATGYYYLKDVYGNPLPDTDIIFNGSANHTDKLVTDGVITTDEDGKFKVTTPVYTALSSNGSSHIDYIVDVKLESDPEKPIWNDSFYLDITYTPLTYTEKWTIEINDSTRIKIGNDKLGPDYGNCAVFSSSHLENGQEDITISLTLSDGLFGKVKRKLDSWKIPAPDFNIDLSPFNASASGKWNHYYTISMKIENYTRSVEDFATISWFLAIILLADINEIMGNRNVSKAGLDFLKNSGLLELVPGGLKVTESGSKFKATGAYSTGDLDVSIPLDGFTIKPFETLSFGYLADSHALSFAEKTDISTREKSYESSYKSSASAYAISGGYYPILGFEGAMGKSEMESTSLTSGKDNFTLKIGKQTTSNTEEQKKRKTFYKKYKASGDAYDALQKELFTINAANVKVAPITAANVENVTNLFINSSKELSYSNSETFEGNMTFSPTAAVDEKKVPGFPPELKRTFSVVWSCETDTETGKYVNGNYNHEMQTADLEPYLPNVRPIADVLAGIPNQIDNALKSAAIIVTGSILEGVENAGAFIKEKADSTKKWFVNITTVKSNAGRSLLSSADRVMLLSASSTNEFTDMDDTQEDVYYEPAVYAADEAAGEDSWGISVGNAYIVTVEDENGNQVTDLSEEPLKLTLSWTDEELETSQLDSDDFSRLGMYYYDEDVLRYIYMNGTVNGEEKSVTCEITRPGEYLLICDYSAPQITDIQVSDTSTTPTISAMVLDKGGISSMVVSLDGGEIVNKGNFNQYLDIDTGEFVYTFTNALAVGSHELMFVAADGRGNESVPIRYSFDVSETQQGAPQTDINPTPPVSEQPVNTPPAVTEQPVNTTPAVAEQPVNTTPAVTEQPVNVPSAITEQPIITPVAVAEKITIKKKPTIKKPSATKNKITVKWTHFKHTSKKTKIIWKAIKKVQVQCATDKAFTNIVKTTTVGKTKKKATIKGLKKNKTYYVRVRYTNKTGYSKWSKVKKIKTKKK